LEIGPEFVAKDLRKWSAQAGGKTLSINPIPGGRTIIASRLTPNSRTSLRYTNSLTGTGHRSGQVHVIESEKAKVTQQ